MRIARAAAGIFLVIAAISVATGHPFWLALSIAGVALVVDSFN